MEWKKANEQRLQLERFRAQLSADIEDTEYWLTLKPTTKERGYVSHIVEVLSLWRQGVNEILSGAQLSDAQRHLYWREYPQLFLHFYRKA